MMPRLRVSLTGDGMGGRIYPPLYALGAEVS